MARTGLIGLLKRLATPQSATEPRSIALGGRPLVYRLRRSARRTLSMRLDAQGVLVAAPLRARIDEIEHFIAQHADWLNRRLQEREAERRMQAFSATDGAGFPLFGEVAHLRVEAGRRRSSWVRDAQGEVLLVGAAAPDEALVRALRVRALPDFIARVQSHCERLGVAVPPVRLTSARTRWGSCSARSGIRLHWRLLHLAPELIDYVVAHEVAHLVEMNHSPRFWTIVGKLHPHWQTSRRRLREQARGLPLIRPGLGPAPDSED